ncbi:MAG: hypothetical protein HYX22_00665 [Candidatus Yanofskybacteria bacterium]|nr:hypothetical protein [Candidatus Yanofskybacteria bacterium]
MEKYKQNIAIEMRKRGSSYFEIGNRIHIPKSTLSYWLKNIKLTPEQTQKLNDKRTEIAKANALKKISKTSRMIEEIRNSSSQDVKEISKKELWLMGVVLYWKNGNKSNLKKGVHFSSSNPDMIKLFLKWLREIGGIQDEEIKFEIFAPKKFFTEDISKWSKVTGFPKHYFKYFYIQKTSFLRIKVAQSSMLARQISGWIEGIKKTNNL